jgi:hypothetical protein
VPRGDQSLANPHDLDTRYRGYGVYEYVGDLLSVLSRGENVAEFVVISAPRQL